MANKLAGFISLILLSAAASPAAFGTVITDTYTSTVASYSPTTTDTNDYFGGGSLSGDTISFGFSYDPGTCSYQNDGSTSNQLYSCGTPVSESVTVNGVTVSATSTNYLNLSSSSTPFGPNGNDMSLDYWSEDSNYLIEIDLYTATPYSSGYIQNQAPSASDLVAAERAPQIAVCPAGQGGNNCEIFFADVAGGITDSSSVAPEPGSLILVSAGVAGLAWIRRRRIASL